MLLIFMLVTKFLFSMESRFEKMECDEEESHTLLDNNEPISDLKDEDKAVVLALTIHITSILCQATNLNEMIDLISEDFKNSYLKSRQKNLYIKIFRNLAKQRFTSEFNGLRKDSLMINHINLHKLQAQETFIKAILAGANFNIYIAIDKREKANKKRSLLISFQTLLNYLVEENHLDLVKLLIICGINFNTKNYLTALSYAQDNIPMTDMLMDFAPDMYLASYSPLGISSKVEFTSTSKPTEWGKCARSDMSL